MRGRPRNGYRRRMRGRARGGDRAVAGVRGRSVGRGVPVGRDRGVRRAGLALSTGGAGGSVPADQPAGAGGGHLPGSVPAGVQGAAAVDRPAAVPRLAAHDRAATRDPLQPRRGPGFPHAPGRPDPRTQSGPGRSRLGRAGTPGDAGGGPSGDGDAARGVPDRPHPALLVRDAAGADRGLPGPAALHRQMAPAPRPRADAPAPTRRACRSDPELHEETQ
jgi:hypothetical protein